MTSTQTRPSLAMEVENLTPLKRRLVETGVKGDQKNGHSVEGLNLALLGGGLQPSHASQNAVHLDLPALAHRAKELASAAATLAGAVAGFSRAIGQREVAIPALEVDANKGTALGWDWSEPPPKGTRRRDVAVGGEGGRAETRGCSSPTHPGISCFKLGVRVQNLLGGGGVESASHGDTLAHMSSASWKPQLQGLVDGRESVPLAEDTRQVPPGIPGHRPQAPKGLLAELAEAKEELATHLPGQGPISDQPGMNSGSLLHDAAQTRGEAANASEILPKGLSGMMRGKHPAIREAVQQPLSQRRDLECASSKPETPSPLKEQMNRDYDGKRRAICSREPMAVLGGGGGGGGEARSPLQTPVNEMPKDLPGLPRTETLENLSHDLFLGGTAHSEELLPVVRATSMAHLQAKADDHITMDCAGELGREEGLGHNSVSEGSQGRSIEMPAETGSPSGMPPPHELEDSLRKACQESLCEMVDAVIGSVQRSHRAAPGVNLRDHVERLLCDLMARAQRQRMLGGPHEERLVRPIGRTEAFSVPSGPRPHGHAESALLLQTAPENQEIPTGQVHLPTGGSPNPLPGVPGKGECLAAHRPHEMDPHPRRIETVVTFTQEETEGSARKGGDPPFLPGEPETEPQSEVPLRPQGPRGSATEEAGVKVAQFPKGPEGKRQLSGSEWVDIMEVTSEVAKGPSAEEEGAGREGSPPHCSAKSESGGGMAAQAHIELAASASLVLRPLLAQMERGEKGPLMALNELCTKLGWRLEWNWGAGCRPQSSMVAKAELTMGSRDRQLCVCGPPERSKKKARQEAGRKLVHHLSKLCMGRNADRP